MNTRVRRVFKLLGLIPIAFALLLGMLALFVEPIARTQTREFLTNLEGATADFSEVQVNLFPLTYRITHLKVRERPSHTKEPSLYVEELTIKPRWSELLRGRLKGDAFATGVKIVFHQPAEDGPPRPLRVERLIPFRAVLERAQVENAEVLYIWIREKNQPSMWFQSIKATLENVASRSDMQRGPMRFSGRGTVQRRGTMAVSLIADPYAVPLNFAGEATISNFDLSQMNALIASTQGIKLTPGNFDMSMSFRCDRGRVRGFFVTQLSGTTVTSADESLGSGLKALLTKLTMSFSTATEGTDSLGRIHFSDNLSDSKLQLWPAMEKVIENAFLLGVQESLKGKSSETGKQSNDAGQRKTTDLKIGR